MFELFFRRIIQNVYEVYRGKNILWHVLAAVITAICVFTGIDWWFYSVTRSSGLHWIVWAAGIGGFFTPIVIPLGIYLWGEFRARPDWMRMGAAAGQAGLLAYLISIFYKSLTGRVEPEFLTTYAIAEDNSHHFNFGFLEHGVFWGWPSSHTTVAFAGAVVIVILARSSAARAAALFGATFIGFGAAVGFHWLSDVVAGAIIGSLVGSIVAYSFKSPSTNPPTPTSASVEPCGHRSLILDSAFSFRSLLQVCVLWISTRSCVQ